MDTIEAQLAAAVEGIAAKDVEIAEARAGFEKVAAENVELTAKVAELTAALDAIKAEKAAAEAAVAEAAAAAMTASEEAAKIVASVGVAPIESAPESTEPKGSILEQYLALSGADRTKFFAEHGVAIRAALRK